jgi:hypothetical protein
MHSISVRSPVFKTFSVCHLSLPTKCRLTLLTVVDMGTYPGSIFSLILAIGLVIIRQRRKRLNLGAPDYQAWHVTVGFSILSNLYMVAMPWYPPSTGATGGDVSFWYATYCAVAIGM